jgi:hypothetical protein
MILVELELGWRRAILLHRLDDLGDAGTAAFGKFEFLEKFADAAVAITPGLGAAPCSCSSLIDRSGPG